MGVVTAGPGYAPSDVGVLLDAGPGYPGDVSVGVEIAGPGYVVGSIVAAGVTGVCAAG